MKTLLTRTTSLQPITVAGVAALSTQSIFVGKPVRWWNGGLSTLGACVVEDEQIFILDVFLAHLEGG